MTHPTTIPMPQLTEQMEEAVIAKWLIEPGAPVEIGDELVEIETDKATMAYASEFAGLLEQLVDEGATVRVGDPIAHLHHAAANAAERQTAPPAAPAATPLAVPDADQAPTSTPTTAAQAAAGPATPLARRAAQHLGVDLAEITGSGPRGRILQGDVFRSAGRVTEQPAVVTPKTAPAAAAPGPIGGGGSPGERRPLSTIQRTIARRMAEAKATVPHFQVSCDVDVDAAMRTRRDLQAQLGEGARGPSLNDFIVRACAVALRDHELVNASFAGDHFELHSAVHVGIAVASDAGLLVATLTDTDRRSLLSIAEESRRLASSVRDGTATPAELTGATFTVSNLGMFGMTSIVPVINPPQAAILGVGAAREELYLQDGQPLARRVASLTLSGDHRVLNGADAARFLRDVKELIEAPLLLLAA